MTIKQRKTKELKDKIIKFRVTETEKELIETYAKFNNMSMSDYILNLVWKDQEKKEGE